MELVQNILEVNVHLAPGQEPLATSLALVFTLQKAVVVRLVSEYPLRAYSISALLAVSWLPCVPVVLTPSNSIFSHVTLWSTRYNRALIRCLRYNKILLGWENM